ncbi:hypothetical protein [Mitsuaria sp. 7]|uniref:hypothetical protein n=1 Tax=Mitsuaria sp. 7 TaxID=1658665 RepID=UPI0007DDA901|nr:hypothetical protein [Mitsuaria sp. 7]ANH67230.1 hypothetical protein ABE85_05980 [Mitsuaria sp. 7]
MMRRKERGLGTLAMCVVLLGVLALGAAWAARQLTTAQRVAANDLRAAAAGEAAESGMAWAVAMLNGGAIDDACRPATVRSAADGGASSDFRGRFLLIGADGHYHAPSPPSAAAPAATTTAAPFCANSGPLRWSCRCAVGGNADAAVPRADGEAQPQFSIRFADAGRPGQLKLIARGCSDRRADCDDISNGPIGVAEVAQHLALLSALRVPPPTAVIEGPGSFLRVFGYPPGRYRDQPALTRLRCSGDCDGSLAQALARGRRLIWIDGDAHLSQWPESALDGTPLVLIVDGRLDLTAAGHPQGVLYAKDGVDWHPPAGLSTSLRGAVISEARVDKAGSVELIHDAAVLYRIHRQMGSFVPVPGGWTPTR